MRVACMHHVRRMGVDLGGRVLLVSRARRSLPCLSVSLLPPLPSQLLSVLLCTLPLGLTVMSNKPKPTQSDRDRSSAFPPALRQPGAQQIGMPAVDCACIPQPSWNPFLSTVVEQRPRASGLGISRPVQAGVRSIDTCLDIQNKSIRGGLPPFPNQTRLSCATNLNITRLISQARDMKPAVGSPSSVPLVKRFTVQF